MPADDALRRLLDAGTALTALTQQRAEALVRDLVKAGEVQADQAQAAVGDLVERSRRNTEKLLEQVRREIRAQIDDLGLASRTDIDRLERKIDALAAERTTATAPATSAPATKARGTEGAGTAAGKKAAAKKATTKKAAGKKAGVKKATAKKSAGKKAGAGAPAKQSPSGARGAPRGSAGS